MANNHYEPELKQKVLRLYLEEGRTKKSLTQEYNPGQGTLTYWLRQYRKECENNSINQAVHMIMQPWKDSTIHSDTNSIISTNLNHITSSTRDSMISYMGNIIT